LDSSGATAARKAGRRAARLIVSHGGYIPITFTL
jgi:hypothetical protein